MLKKRIKNSLIGFIIGDALGVPFEFRSAGNFICKGYSEFGTHNQPKGTWSDDTSLMLTYLDSEDSLKLQKANLKDWFNRGDYCCDNGLFDIGYLTGNAIVNGFKVEEDINNNGNGGLLRVWPMAFKDIDYSKIVSFLKLTHNHEINFRYSLFFITFFRELENTDKFIALSKIESELSVKINRSNFSNSGYVVDTVESSINWFLKYDNFKDCVLGAINGGDDTDSVGALVGALAGYYFGRINIRNEVRNFDKIIGVIDNFVDDIK